MVMMTVVMLQMNNPVVNVLKEKHNVQLESVSELHGNVMAMKTVPMVQMRLTALE